MARHGMASLGLPSAIAYCTKECYSTSYKATLDVTFTQQGSGGSLARTSSHWPQGVNDAAWVNYQAQHASKQAS